MKKKFSVILIASLSLAIFAGGSKDDAAASTTTDAAMVEDKVYTINYPQDMKDFGFTDPVVLDKKPTRVVCMADTPVLTLHNVGVELVGVPASPLITWPQELNEKTTMLNIAMNSNFDIETVVALEPDLVLIGKSSRETYGKIFNDANIPVYYVNSGHTVSYDSVKMLTYELLETFGGNSEAANKIKSDFKALEERLAEFKMENEPRSVMVFQSAPPRHYIQSPNGTLASMLHMMGFTNVYEKSEATLVPLDFEQVILYEPDLFFAVGMPDNSAGLQKIMEEDYKNNQAYWDSIEAIKKGDTFYMPVYYISSTGINVIDKINELIDLIEAYDEKQEKMNWLIGNINSFCRMRIIWICIASLVYLTVGSALGNKRY